MKQLTRQEVEAVVERLVDKTLSEGCIIESDGIKYHVARAAKKIIYCYLTWTDRETNIIKFDRVNDKYQIIGHQVIIGTVLEKMKEQNILYANAPDPRGDDNAGWILDYWSKCGFSRSLQEIILESEWSHSAHAKVCNVGHEEVLTSPEANALFTFLQEIL